MRNLTKIVFAAAALLGSATIALAEDAPAPSWSLAGSLAAQSDYRFRGISQSNKKLVPQGSLNLSGPDGFYVGTWASKINWDLNGVNDNPSIEWDIYGGKHFDLGGTDLNVEAYEYAYPDASQPKGSKAASFFEGIFTLSHTFGPLALDVVYAVSPQFSLGGGTGNYIEGQGTFTITDWLTISGNVGHQWVENAPSDYTHADIGATATWKMLSLDARYVTTDIGKVNCAAFWMGTKNACSGGFVGTVTWNIALAP
ncbi:MAG TPA: TorF family putative porin [Rhizomicrobium sp.]|nr:TorF family putative porin [Rhizomicrobium sp.]